MSRDLEAVVWTRLNMTPIKMGRLYLTETENRFTYDEDYLTSGLRGLGLVLSPSTYQDNTIVRKRTERFDFLPPIQGLIPPREKNNFQRNLAIKYLKSKGVSGLSGFEMDWEILKLSGHGGIGHLDVFENDDDALRWYGTPDKDGLFEISDTLSFSLKQFLTWFDEDAEAFIQLIGPTPSVGGAIPKLLLSIPDTGWDGRIGLPSKQPRSGVTDVVLKFEQTATYPGIIELEALTLDVHRRLGFDVPRYWTTEISGIPAIAIERFDRTEHHTPRFTETVFSIIASGNPDIPNHYEFSYDGIAKALDRPELNLVSDSQACKEHLFKRLIASFVTGNGDLHLENLSILAKEDSLAFSPVYDPTPMRAYPIHNMMNVMPFGDYAQYIEDQDDPINFQQALHRFARSCGLKPGGAQALIDEVLDKTRDYAERVDALETLPATNKEKYTAILEKMRALLRPL